MAEAAGGIDRKADERMEFSTSKEVTVHPTFESMSLKGRFDLLRCAREMLISLSREPAPWDLRLWIRISLRRAVQSHCPGVQGTGHDRASPVRNWQDRYVLDQHAPGY